VCCAALSLVGGTSEQRQRERTRSLSEQRGERRLKPESHICGALETYRLAYALVHSQAFDVCILLVIMVSSLALAADNPRVLEGSSTALALYWIDLVCTIIFALEMFLKVRCLCAWSLSVFCVCVCAVCVVVFLCSCVCVRVCACVCVCRADHGVRFVRRPLRVSGRQLEPTRHARCGLIHPLPHRRQRRPGTV
jgi:hypothetical protein